MQVQMIADGLWRWTAPHPDWTPDADWEQEVACFYYEGFEGLCLIDPLVPQGDEERFWQALDEDVDRRGLPVAVILTTWYHERSAAVMRERYAATVWAFGPTVGRLSVQARPFAPGTPLPGGLEAFATDGEEVLLWLPEHRALISGDLLIGEPGGVRVCPDSWLPDGASPAAVRAVLRQMLELPVERLLVGHGPSVLHGGHDALVEALGHDDGPSPAPDRT